MSTMKWGEIISSKIGADGAKLTTSEGFLGRCIISMFEKEPGAGIKRVIVFISLPFGVRKKALQYLFLSGKAARAHCYVSRSNC